MEKGPGLKPLLGGPLFRGAKAPRFHRKSISKGRGRYGRGEEGLDSLGPGASVECNGKESGAKAPFWWEIISWG